MSGPQLTALVATVVALVALVGVGALVLQIRRLRAEMSVVRASAVRVGDSSEVTVTDRAAVQGSDAGSDAGSGAVPAVTQTQPGEPPPATRSTGPDRPSATVVELVPVPSDPARNLPTSLSRHQQMVAARLAQPLVRMSAVSYGVRHALRAENRDRVAALVRRDLRRRHKLRRLAGRRAFRVVSLRPDDSTGPDADRQESAS